MSNRLYYTNPALHDFDSVVEETIPPANGQPRAGVVLRETAFYPTSGGQVYDTGWLVAEDGTRVRVAEVAETDDAGLCNNWKEMHEASLPAQPCKAASIPSGDAITCSSTQASMCSRLLSSSCTRCQRFLSTWARSPARLI